MLIPLLQSRRDLMESIEEQHSHFLGNERYSGADGDDESGEPDTTDSTSSDESGVPSEDLPKFRQLVKAKKRELKTLYGKGHCEVTKAYGGNSVGDTVSWAACNIGHRAKTKWVRGWRWKWKEFKDSGGKAILKAQAKGTASVPTPIIEALDSTWAKIGKENEQITVPAGTVVRFGSGSSWIEKTVSGTFPATRTYFGSDPAVGVLKEVYKKIISTGTEIGISTDTGAGTVPDDGAAAGMSTGVKVAIIGTIAIVVILGAYFGYKTFVKPTIK